MEALYEKAVERVKDMFAADFSGHDMAHTARVTALARRLAKETGADERLVTLAALLHDADDRKLSPATCARKDNARRILMDLAVNERETEKIIRMISQISYSSGLTPDSLEGRVVQDADRLDAIGAIGIARTFAYGGSHHRPLYDPQRPPRPDMSPEEYAASESTSINHFYEKLLKLKDTLNTPEAREIARGRHAFMVAYLEQFQMEVEGRA